MSIKKIIVLILVFSLLATAVAHENKNDGKDGDSDDGDAGQGNDDMEKPHEDDGLDGGAGGSGDSSGSGIGTFTLSTNLNGFSGDAFGNGDCERVSILTKQLDNETLIARAKYKLQIIADEYDLTIDEFIRYKCSKTGLSFYPSGGGGTSGSPTWLNISIGEATITQAEPQEQHISERSRNETFVRQLEIGGLITGILLLGLWYLHGRYKRLT